MIDLARLGHKVDEFVDQFIMQFKRAHMQCQTTLPKTENVKLAMD